MKTKVPRNANWECLNCGGEGEDAKCELLYTFLGDPRCPDCASPEVEIEEDPDERV